MVKTKILKDLKMIMDELASMIFCEVSLVIIDKGKGLLEVMRVLKTMKDEIVAIGISNNDLPLFRDVGQSIIVGNKPVAYHRAKRFSDIGEALDYLKSLFNVSNG